MINKAKEVAKRLRTMVFSSDPRTFIDAARAALGDTK